MLRQTFLRAFSPNFTYTCGHAIDNGSDVRNNLATNSYDLKSERGSSTFDIRHIVTSFATYEVPQWAKFAPRLTKGWQVNALTTLHGGSPMNIFAGTNVSGPGENRDPGDLFGEPVAHMPGAPRPHAVPHGHKAGYR